MNPPIPFGILLRTSIALFAVAWLAATHSDAATNLVWQSGPGFRFATLPVPTSGRAGFTLLNPNDTGISFSNRLSDATVATNRLYEIGSGVALLRQGEHGDVACQPGSVIHRLHA